MPVNVAQVRIKVANRERLTDEELDALIDAEGWFMGRPRVRTVNGFMILFGQPVPNDPSHPAYAASSRLPRGRIWVATMGGDRGIYAEAAMLAALMWGAGGTVRVRGQSSIFARPAAKPGLPSSIPIPAPRPGGRSVRPGSPSSTPCGCRRAASGLATGPADSKASTRRVSSTSRGGKPHENTNFIADA